MEKKNKIYIPIIFISLLALLVILNLLLGVTNSLKGFLDIFNGIKSTESIIITSLRLPRTIAVILVGAGLATAGLLLQTMLNNSLASPSIVGINSGAGLGIVLISIIVPFYSQTLTTIATLLGAFLSSMLIYLIARLTGASRGKLILAGVAISRLISAIIDCLIYFYPNSLTNKQLFQLGSFARVTFSNLYISGPLIIIGLIGAVIISKYLDILILGDETAQSLGLNVKVTRFLLILIIALLSAASVSIVGLLSFLGLIIPHIVKRIFGIESHRKLVLYTILFGADFTLICDLIARTCFGTNDLPVGIILSIIGIPFFIYLLFNRGGKRRVINSHKLER